MIFFDYLLIFISMMMIVILILLSAGFLTLLERKILGYIQLRKGPNKSGILGLAQPFSDGFKLFTKEQVSPLMSNYLIYYLSPVFNLFLSFFIWLLLPFFTCWMNFNFGFFFFLCVSSLGVYTIMLSGWSSNSMYSLLGGLRSIAQTISYEVSLIMIILPFLFYVSSFNFLMFSIYQYYLWFLFLFFPLALIWFVSMLAETNRTPFDFSEGESELVSGFNVEYSAGGFSLISLAEYSNIIFMSMMFVLLFLGADYFSFFFFFKLVFICFVFILSRGTLPRYRYDKLMYLSWKCYLPFSLNLFMYYYSLKLIIFINLI
uniref:NADH-ubiquinone oxidoreductase chain 1 n=1 Tax=Endelus continentalis TaxID=2984121 RepID=A0A977XWJ8_9COLE|nr:NADH dehydrogenase subunit 1 [Endelus continentalis]UXX50483.1 NADH dehydrogenase subunit 1 [Endelus continentalis]